MNHRELKESIAGNETDPIERSLRIFGLLVLLQFLLLSLWFKLPSDKAIRFANFVSNTLLTVLLLFAYLRSTEIQDSQEEIQEEQKEIQSQQRDLLRLEHKPKLKVRRIKIENSPSSFKLMISNIGKAPASDIILKIVPHTECDNLTLAPSHDKIGRENSDSSWFGADDNYLEPNETDVFTAQAGPRAKREDLPMEKELVPWAFELITEKLSEHGEKVYRFSLILEYEGPDQTEYSEEFVTFMVPIKGRTALSKAIELGTTQEQYESKPKEHRTNLHLRQVNMDKDTAEKTKQIN